MRSINSVLIMALLIGAARGQEAAAKAQTAPAKAQEAAPSKDQKPAAPAEKVEAPAAYVGSETCGACHEDIAKAFAKTPHHLADGVDKKRGFDGKACESCHGSGGKHAGSADAADIRNPGKLAAAAVDKICLTCHLNQPTHIGRLASSHAKDLVA